MNLVITRTEPLHLNLVLDYGDIEVLIKDGEAKVAHIHPDFPGGILLRLHVSPSEHEALARISQLLWGDEYRDDSYPERACDRCGALYRGPAVYCSKACAVADA